MSQSIRLADNIIDENPPLSLLPNLRAAKNDLGILKKMVNINFPIPRRSTFWLCFSIQ